MLDDLYDYSYWSSANYFRYVDYESLYNEMQAKLDAAEQKCRIKDSELSNSLLTIECQRQEIELQR